MKEKDWKSQVKKTVLQIIRFGFVGVLNNLISLVVYYIVVFIRQDIYLLGNALGFLVSTLNAYVWNSRFVFRSGERPSKGKGELLKTYCVYAVSLCISTLLLYILVDLLRVSTKIAPICSLMVTVPFNFVLNKLWIYRKSRGTE